MGETMSLVMSLPDFRRITDWSTAITPMNESGAASISNLMGSPGSTFALFDDIET